MVLEDALAERAHALRAFSRFYTAIIGALEEGLLETPYSLTEARVIFESGGSRRSTWPIYAARSTSIPDT